MKRQSVNRRSRDIARLGLSVLIVLLCNYLGSFIFHRFDLTSEKRFTLSPESVKTAKNLKGTAFFKVYLDGKLPAGFIRLRDETKEMLDEFRAYSGGRLQYEFIDPSANPDPKQREAFYKQLFDQGLTPTNLEVRDNSGNSEQIIFPGAILSYQGREMPIDILQQQENADPQTTLNNSIEALEYDLDNAIHKLSVKLKPRVAFIMGHGELDSIHEAGATAALQEYYDVRRVPLDHKLSHMFDYSDTTGHKLNLKYAAIIIAKPMTAFDEQDKFIIDQYIMHGGKVLWLISPLYTSLDSLRINGITYSLPLNLNLQDQMFKYGVRLNNNIIMDYLCSVIPLNNGFPGQQPDIKLYPWYYCPLISPTSNNPIVKNLNFIELCYASTLDTIGTPGIRKTFLLRTSKETKLLGFPVRISLGTARIPPSERQFNNPFQPVAVLLEGKFQSLYKNRMVKQLDTSRLIDFMSDGLQTSMIVVSDGNVIENDVKESGHFAYPLGYDKYANQQFGNKNFIVNCMNYLCGDSTLLATRTKQLELRLIDKKKTHLFRTQWQLINLGIPVGLIVLLGLGLAWIRKRKYSS